MCNMFQLNICHCNPICKLNLGKNYVYTFFNYSLIVNLQL